MNKKLESVTLKERLALRARECTVLRDDTSKGFPHDA